MKKVGMIFGIFIAIIAVFVFINKLYYPSLPVDGISAKEAIDKLKESDSKVVEISLEGDSIWYITSSENKGISIVDENIKQMIVSNGWEFQQKDGSGLFFEKNGERLIVTTQMWTKNYVLVKVPSNLISFSTFSSDNLADSQIRGRGQVPNCLTGEQRL